MSSNPARSLRFTKRLLALVTVTSALNPGCGNANSPPASPQASAAARAPRAPVPGLRAQAPPPSPQAPPPSPQAALARAQPQAPAQGSGVGAEALRIIGNDSRFLRPNPIDGQAGFTDPRTGRDSRT
jgi:hypothetical protein